MKRISNFKHMCLFNSTKIYLLITTALLTISCENLMMEKEVPDDVYSIFDDAWSMLDARYPLFQIKGIDWNASYDKYRAKLYDNMPDDEFFVVLGDLIVSLRDSHTDLRNTQLSLKRSYWPHTDEYSNQFNIEVIKENYLNGPDFSKNAVLVGKIRDVGYVYIKNFSDELSPGLAEEILSYLAGADKIVFDVRNNQGGSEGYGNNIISRFIQDKIPIKIIETKTGSGEKDYTRNLSYLNPTETYYPYSQIVVLANQTTFSAGNDFVNQFSQLPRVTLIGDTTGGGGTTPHFYELANGWLLRYSSNIQYRASDSLFLDGGIPPDIYVKMQKSDHQDVVLDRALLVLAD